MWALKPTRIAGETIPDDMVILRHRQVVGRVHRGNDWDREPRYRWSTFTYPCNQGTSPSFAEATHALREAVRQRWPDDVPAVPLAGAKRSDPE